MKVISQSDMAPSQEGINSIKMKRTCLGVKPACYCPGHWDFGQLAQTMSFNFFI